MIARLYSIRTRSLFCKLFPSLLVCFPLLASAETFRCTAGDVGCLIASIAKANVNGPSHDYLFIQAGTYLLERPDNGQDPLGVGGNGLPVVTGALTIVGGGTGVTLLARRDTAPPFRLFEVAPTGGLTVAYLTLAEGNLFLGSGQGSGGCVLNTGSMMLIDVVVRECAANNGGALANGGEMLLLHSVIIENYAEFAGGAIVSSGVLTIKQGSWIGSSVAFHGGCIATRGRLTIERSVVDGCIAIRMDGGGIDMLVPFDNQVDITQTLISDNFAGASGGGAAFMDGDVTITKSTLWGNTAAGDGGGLYVNGGEATLTDVAVLLNRAGEVIPGQSDFYASGLLGIGGGLATAGDGIATLERTWLLWNAAETHRAMYRKHSASRLERHW